MEMPDSSASSEVLLRTFGAYHRAALSGAAPAAEIRSAFESRQAALEAALGGRIAASDAQSAAEALRVSAETEVERILMRLELITLGGVNKKRDRDPYKTAYPKGTEGAVAPKGRAQVAEARRIGDYLAPTTGSAPTGVPSEAATIIAELRTALGILDARVVAEESAEAAHGNAFLSELSERRSWREQYRKSHGQLTAVYGQDKKKVESFFKRAGKKKKKAGDTDPPPA